MNTFRNKKGKVIVMNMIKTIQANKNYLSEIDGAIGDGDHGINMNKGFTLCEERIKDQLIDFSTAMSTLGDVLFNEIGGSMGPLYGLFFSELGNSIAGQDEIDQHILCGMLSSGLNALQEMVSTKVGDKTMFDALIPAVSAMRQAADEGKNFEEALILMKDAAQAGKDSTKELIAKVGRASRLGERSRGVIDAGAASCSLLLGSLADSVLELLRTNLA
ncbi:MAG: dihydroxyacetone kinase subunit DhaL [Christensenellales bacterium]